MTTLKTLPAALTAGLAVAAVIALWISGTAGSQSPPSKHAYELTAPAIVSGPPALPEAPTTIQRTFVSTSGNDANPCTVTAPCRNFAAAIANTTIGGEVVALDSGGYGAFTVPKAITIAGAPGRHVAVTAFAGTAIDVNAGAGNVVVLRNLYLTGLGGVTGILLQSDSVLHVDSVVATGFGGDGLAASADTGALFVRDSSFRHNGGSGVLITGLLPVVISDSRAEGNDAGFVVSNGRATVVRTTATGNAVAGFVFADGGGTVSDSAAARNGSVGVDVQGSSDVTLSGVELSNNPVAGLDVISAGSVARIGGSTATRNGTGLKREAGTLESFGDNLVRGNTTNTSGTITAVGKT